MQTEIFATESDERLAALVSHYGVGTRSYNHSPEKREMDRQRAAVTEKFLAEPAHPEPDIPLLCPCPQRPYPHELHIHNQLLRESWNPRLKYVWPWSLAFAEVA